MDLFDLHCDTIFECAKTGQEIYDNVLAVSVKKSAVFSRWCQMFALFIPDSYRGEAAFEFYKKLLHVFQSEMKKNAAHITFCCKGNELDRTEQREKATALLSVEGGAALGGRLENLEVLHDDGVKAMTLTWNGDNEIASGCCGSGGGLTAFGRNVMEKMLSLGMLADVSHLNERGFFEVCEYGMPMLATHSNLKSVFEHERNLTDRQFETICRSGGLVGINLYPLFLNGGEKDIFDAVFRHVYHALEIGGEDHIAIGSDFDGAKMNDALCSIDKIPQLYDYLCIKNFSETLINKLFYRNVFDFFSAC